MSVQSKASIDKRLHLVESAANCFLRLGFNETSLDDIASHSGVVKQTIYNYFENKEALFKAAIEYLLSINTLAPERSWLQLDPEEFLTRVGKLQLKSMKDPGNMDFLRLLVKECRKFPELQGVYAQSIPKPIIDFISEYITMRGAYKGLPSQALAWSFRACLSGYATLSNLESDVPHSLPSKSKYLDTVIKKFAAMIDSKDAVLRVVHIYKASQAQEKADNSPLFFLAESQPKRLAIFLGAMHCFSEKGYAETSMDEVAAISSTAKQTVYKYFRSKSILYTELWNSAVTALSNRQEEGIKHDLLQYCQKFLAINEDARLREYFRVVLGESVSFPMQSGALLLYLFDSNFQNLLTTLGDAVGLSEETESLAIAVQSMLGYFTLIRQIYTLDENPYLNEEMLLKIVLDLAKVT
jgi:AcrR family transcriptional regulator